MDRGVTERPPRCSSLWITSDFSIAAYLSTAGVPLCEARPKNGNARHADFVFSDPDDLCPNLAIQFVGSDAARFDMAQRAIKKLTFGWKQRGLAGARGDWKTADLQIAAWLVMRYDPTMRLVGFRRTHSRRRQYEFYFEGDSARLDTQAEEYAQSAARRYSDAQKKLSEQTIAWRHGGARAGIL